MDMNTGGVTSPVFYVGKPPSLTAGLTQSAGNLSSVGQPSFGPHASPNSGATGVGATATNSTLVDQLNHKLQPQGLSAVFQYDDKAHMTWINIINKATGQVVDKYPPERIRKMMDNFSNAGLTYDKHL